MATVLISKTTPLTKLVHFLILTSSLLPILSINITNLLSPYPDLSSFTSLLLSTSVAADLSNRSSVTLLAVPNSALRLSGQPSPSADVLRYHVLLEYLSPSDLRQISPAGKLVNTLYQATGRASGDSGSVNVSSDPVTGAVTVGSPASQAKVVNLIKSIPYNVTIYSINSLLIPSDSDLMASENRPVLGLNITKALIDGHGFNVAVAMLAGSGVVDELEADEGGAGITLFIPTDEAFADLPVTARFQSLPADKKAVVLKFHVLHSYYPLGSLESIVNPVQPTLATEDMGAGSYTLNISRVNGSVEINSGIVQATVTRTVFDENPVVIFGVSKVLLPKEIFVNNKRMVIGAPPPDELVSPGSSLEMFGPVSHLPSPPWSSEDARSEAANNRIHNYIICCIGLYLLV
ncbi:hypothetical protein LguiA_012098 [Lonicera macranthoides]